ncbi:MAG TPA: VapC toxin family PIN domain ribonuclease [Verrucomicrobiales bacterium]|nr:VapC toxin family PIN domain ribonuclease [Verrucomicrobiales bacterium]
MSHLVDANVLCEATRPEANPNVLAWLEKHDADLHVSVITLGEIEKGIRLLPRSRKRSQLERWYDELVASFEGRVLPVDQAVMSEWSALYARNQKAGRLLPGFDSLLAATAACHGLTIATRNADDFPADAKLVNPWKAG